MSLTEKELNLLKEIVSLPTAPFCEQAVIEYILNWCNANNFSYKQDKSGNILVCPDGIKLPKNKIPWVLQAHMDHPGFVYISRKGSIAKAWFRGGVDKKYFPGSKMMFTPSEDSAVAPVKGIVKSAVKDKATGFLKCSIQMARPVDLPAGTLGMWDLPTWKLQKDKLSLRVADDLAGVASVLLTLTRLKRKRSAAMPLALFTRAEETAFIGATAAAKSGLIKKNWPILGIETSKAQPAAPLGKGAVIRLGDRMSIFDPDLTMILRHTADKIISGPNNIKLIKQGGGCVYNAALMPGGSTESTLLALMGYRTCAVCLPLGNYHNMGQAKIAPEKISINDMASLVELLAQTTQQDIASSASANLKTRLMKIYNSRKHLLNE